MINNYLLGTICSTLFLGVLFLIEYITRKNNYSREITRRLAHVLSGLFAIITGFILEPRVFTTFVVIFLVIITLSYRGKFFSSIHNVKRKTYGEILLPMGILLAFIVSDGATPLYLASVLILALSDPLAGIIGSMMQRKSKYGSLTFFISALIILAIVFDGNQILVLISIAIVITGVERISSLGTDNLTIPLVSALLLRFLF